MADSLADAAIAAEPRPDKRTRLVDAAARLLHEQGIERTTLADIAQHADVPAGNVYYYFKTKDEIVAAVIAAHAQRGRETLAAIDARHRSAKGRLKGFVREVISQREMLAENGCPLGGLCAEVGKRAGGESDATAVALMRLPIEWAETQFRALGRRDAHDLALELIAAYEGSALLANALRDPDVLTRVGRRLDRWIDAL
jgi:AcrR family transcriptional regulator